MSAQVEETLFGLVKKHPKGPLHLVEGVSERALCGARRPSKSGWAVVARGLVTARHAADLEGVCHPCLRELRR